MYRCRPKKIVHAYQWLSCEKQVYCRPIIGKYVSEKMKFQINFSVTFFKMEDGRLTKTRRGCFKDEIDS